MSFTTHSDGQDRDYVLGQDLRATILTTAAETEGRHDMSECLHPSGSTTPESSTPISS